MFIVLNEIARYSIKGNSELYAYIRQHTVTYHISNNILGIVKFGVTDLRVMPFMKKSHVVYSKFHSLS